MHWAIVASVVVLAAPLAPPDDIVSQHLADRVPAQVAATNSVIVGRAEIGAWTRMPP